MSSSKPSRRNLIIAGVASAGAATAAARLAGEFGLIPPDGRGIWAPGHSLTYGAQRLLTTHSLAREFRPDQISRPSYPNGRPPNDEAFLRLEAGGFADWRLVVDGMVTRPASFTLSELRGFPSRSQITHLACEEGWSFIAQWSGVPLAAVLERVGIAPQARFVVYKSIQPRWWDSIDMADALHPQTLITYGMNDGDLPTSHGGPLRVRVPRQLGYKSVKYITSLTVTDSLEGFGKGMGSFAAERGYSWYNGI